MNPSIVPLVPIELDRPRNLRLSMGAVKRAEQVTGGRNLIAALLSGNVSATDLCALMWAGLIHEDKDLTLEQLEEMLPFGWVERCSAALLEAITAALPKHEGGETTPLTHSLPAGRTFGQSDASTSDSRKKRSGI